MKRTNSILRHLLRIAIPWFALLLSHSYAQPLSCAQESPPKELETFVLAEKWDQVEAVSLAWLRTGSRRQAAILCGYAALARGEGAAASRHFLRARRGPGQTLSLPWAESMAARQPERWLAHLLSGDALARKGNTRTSLSELQQAAERNQDSALPRIALGALLLIRGEPEAAVTAVDFIPPDHPLASEVLLIKSFACMELQDLAGALAAVNQAVKRAPEHAVAYNTRGLIYAQVANWTAAMRDFEIAFRLAPELTEARENWQLARTAAQQRGAETTARWQMGVFGTGINAEAEFDYAASHARDLVSGRPQTFLYVGIKGNLPLAGVEKMARQGVQTVTVDFQKPDAANVQIDSFIKQSVTSGKNPIIFIDVNKWVPKQLGNNKDTAIGLPAEIAVRANHSFQREVTRLGGDGSAILAGHSDFTWVGMKASALATKQGVPFQDVILESPRTEAGVQEAVKLSPSTRFTVVQPKQGDFFTQEAQGRFLTGQRGAYGQTIDTFKRIDAPNYRLALIENPTPNGLLGMPQAHGDPAHYDRQSKLTIWNGGNQISASDGRLGQLLTGDATRLLSQPAVRETQRGGIWITPISLSQQSGGRIVFGAGDKGAGSFKLVFPLFCVSKAPKPTPGMNR
jgi:tetratricopeptide (TPR) repeat protein